MNYCYECDKNVEINYQKKIYVFDIADIRIDFVDDVVICNTCGNEIYVMELHDRIINKAHNLFKKRTASD